MKKVLVFVLIVLASCSTALIKFEKNPAFELDGVEKICFVKNSAVNLSGVEPVICGDLVFNYCSPNVAKENLQILKNDVKSVEFYVKNAKKDDILQQLQAETIFSQQIDNLCVICAYTPFYDDCVFLDGKKVNLQIAAVDGMLIAGFPMILTGF